MAPPLQVALIVQARMGASRLPGKPLKEVLNKSLLAYLIERLKRAQSVDRLCIATTIKSQDDVIAAVANELKTDLFRGSEEDVLDRYWQAAKELGCQIIVRITSDCPLMDPALIDQLVEAFKNQYSSLDYLSNTLERTYPRGMDVEVFSYYALEKAANEAREQAEREHVTLYLYRHPELFRLKNIPFSENCPFYRLTVDTSEDFDLIKLIIEELYPRNPHFTLSDVLQLLKQHPEWAALNAHITQKPV